MSQGTDWRWQAALAALAFSRPVYARMRRTTDRQASVPEFTKRTISTDGTRSITILASTFCGGGGRGEGVR